MIGGIPHNNQLSRAFLSGLMEPSLTAVSVALVVCGALFLTALIGIDREFIASGGHRYFASDQHDFPVTVTSEALRMAAADDSRMLVVTGASSTRVSVRKETMEYITRSRYGVYKLCTGRQSLWETAMLLGMIPDGASGIVVIGLGPSRFTIGPETLREIVARPRLALTSPAFDEELVWEDIETQTKTGNYFLDNRHFFMVRMKYFALNLLRGPPEPADRYFGLDRLAPGKFDNIANMVSQRLEFYEKNRDYFLAVLERLISRVKARTQMKIVLLEHPVDPRFVTEYMGEAFYEVHRTWMRNFSQSQDITYLAAGDLIPLLEDDFYDWTHLRKEGLAKKYTENLVRTLIEIDEKSAEIQYL